MRFTSFLTNWTSRVVCRQLFEAVPVYGMSTRHFVRCEPGTEQIFLTDRTVAHVLSRFAIVIIEQLDVDAHATIIAMPKIISAAHPTKSARGTMIRGFIIRHPQITNTAVIFAKLNTTRNTVVAVYFPPRIFQRKQIVNNGRQ
jgi:hypothetical protein